MKCMNGCCVFGGRWVHGGGSFAGTGKGNVGITKQKFSGFGDS
jgi:hypothetical protein